MTLDYTKMFLIVTEEAVVKGHFALICTAPLGHFLLPGRRSGAQDLTWKILPATGHAPPGSSQPDRNHPGAVQ